MTTEINAYIEKRYNRWLDYSIYHCTQAGIADESIDVLNEVIVALLQKDDCKLLKLMNSKKCAYTELDFYVLRMIKLNAYSATSPYQNKYKPIKVDSNIDFRRLNIEDVQESEDEDTPSIILKRFELVRNILDELNLSKKAKAIFDHKFTYGLSFKEWSGSEDLKELYTTYKKVEKLIRAKIQGETLL